MSKDIQNHKSVMNVYITQWCFNIIYDLHQVFNLGIPVMVNHVIKSSFQQQ